MKRGAVVVGLVAMAAVGVCQSAPVTLEAHLDQKGGWMPDGWGGYRITLTNVSVSSVKVVKWSAEWQVKGSRMGDAWGGDLDSAIEPGKTFVKAEVGNLPLDVYRAALPDSASIVGSFTVVQDGHEYSLPYRIAVPGAKLPEPLKEIDGKTVGLRLMASRFKTFKHVDRTLKWIDQCYQAMIDLTGEHPFGGARMIYLEAPPHPYWAYAGKEMILNTDYVGSTLKDFDDGLISFGWVHEVGHNFDVLGDWYIWSGAAAEWQANFKLSYAMESIPDQSFRIKWTFQAPGYPSPDKERRLTGHELVDKFFLMFGDGYLADPKREWTSLSSDEMHTFFQRIQVVYGWDVFKAWYRTYRKLADAGLKPPETPEAKVNLAAAILSRECHVDLVPVFARWRFPVSEESMKAAASLYGIGS
jgi:hypothetical protein